MNEVYLKIQNNIVNSIKKKPFFSPRNGIFFNVFIQQSTNQKKMHNVDKNSRKKGHF